MQVKNKHSRALAKKNNATIWKNAFLQSDSQ